MRKKENNETPNTNETTREERIRKVNTELKKLGLMEFNKSMKRYEYHIHINDYLAI